MRPVCHSHTRRRLESTYLLTNEKMHRRPGELYYTGARFSVIGPLGRLDRLPRIHHQMALTGVRIVARCWGELGHGRLMLNEGEAD